MTPPSLSNTPYFGQKSDLNDETNSILTQYPRQ
jgi:hypothetical protein